MKFSATELSAAILIVLITVNLLAGLQLNVHALGVQYVFDKKWPTGSMTDLNGPWAIAIDSSGYVYVADAYNNRIQKFTSDGKFVSMWGGFGSNVGQFYFPCGIAVDVSGNVYIADSGNNRIQKFTSNGEFLAQWGGRGTGDGQLWSPWDVAVDGSGNVYVADSRAREIQETDLLRAFSSALARSHLALALLCSSS